ncbi:MAG: hypothetical protein JWL57_894 [Actinobacteria bacterium]|nr:hypothetical protein [Actinomycetota bacterium]
MPLSLTIGVISALLIPVLLVLRIQIALWRRIRDRAWVIGCSILSALTGGGAWVAYLVARPQAYTFSCAVPTLPTSGGPDPCPWQRAGSTLHPCELWMECGLNVASRCTTEQGN